MEEAYPEPTFQEETREFIEPYLPPRVHPVCVVPPPHSLPVAGTPPIPGQTAPYRHPDFVDRPLITVPHDDPTCTTLVHIIIRGKDKWPNRNCMATRKVRGVKEIEKKPGQKWTVWDLDEYEYMTFSDVYKEVRTIGAGFRALGLKKEENGGRVGIYMQTCAKWIQTSLGAQSESLTIVTAYDTLGPAALSHSLTQTNSTALVTEARLLPTIANLISNTPTVSIIIYTTDYGPADPEVIEKIKSLSSSKTPLRFFSWDDFCLLGREFPTDAMRLPHPEDYACVMYTSGSTGAPKGVILRHKAAIAAVAAAQYSVGKWVTPQDRFLAYLPLAHIVEYALEHCSIYWGSCLGYGRPQTLTPAGGSLAQDCKGDIEGFAPTIMVGVPAVWESVKKGIVRKIALSGGVNQKIFDTALALRMWAYGGQGVTDPVEPKGLSKLVVSAVDSIIFSKIRAAVGGHLRVGLSGAAKLNSYTGEWLTHVLGVPIIKGYAMTETAALLAIMPPEQFNPQSDGQIVPCIEIKLVDYPEAGYTVLDQPNPRGEIVIRGPCLSDGYFLPEDSGPGGPTERLSILAQNAEAWQHDPADGHVWFHTGDIGELEMMQTSSHSSTITGGDPNRTWGSGGHIRIIDRKKNLVKTSRGEYIALEKLESIYRACPSVLHICIFATSEKPKPVALVYPLEAHLRNFIVPNLPNDPPGPHASLDELVKREDVNKAVLAELRGVAKQAGLSGFEILDAVGIVGGEEWAPENGLLTSAKKIKRREVEGRFKDVLEGAWGRVGG